MQFDSNRAWRDASAAVNANREVLAALAGVFILLPGLALSLFYPEPPTPDNPTPAAMMAVMRSYYGGMMLYLVPVFVLQTLGTLAMLQLFADRARPTVAEAIRAGAGGTLSYLGVQLLILAACVLAALIAGAGGALSGSGAVTVLLLALLLVAAMYVSARLAVVAPVIAVDHERNPLAAMARSWALTQGNAGRVFGFLILVALGFLAVIMVLLLVTGALLAILVGGEAARIVAAVISATLTTVFTVYLTACTGAVHRQLGGGSPKGTAQVFE